MKEKSEGYAPVGQDDIYLTPPAPEDGAAVHQLVENSPPLDPNSLYCNLLQCSHFAETSVAARMGERLVGFISGYRIPARPDTQFVWQVVVSDVARGRGLAKRMLRYLTEQTPAVGNAPPVRFLETTITPDNEASWALFRSFARDFGAAIEETVLFGREHHFEDRHDDEVLLRIGPLNEIAPLSRAEAQELNG